MSYDEIIHPSTELIKLPVENLLKKFGAGSHKPGSGSAAALIGLIACKMIQTVVALTSGRDKYKGVQEQLTLANQNIIDDIEPFLVRAFQEDSIQFDKVIQARNAVKQEKDPKKRKALSDEALSELRQATQIAVGIAEKSLELAGKASSIFDFGFQSARGDSGVAISAALSAASGAISIVYLNLTSFKGGEWAVQTNQKADLLFAQINELQAGLFARISGLQKEVIDHEPKAQ